MTDPRADRRDAKQRIRIGLTGLAGVLVLVLLAAAMLGLRSADPGGAGGHGANGRVIAREAKDPLAELGVIPGGSSEPAPVATVPATTLPRAAAPANGRVPGAPPASAAAR